jgi:hypothetical protein
LSSFIRENERIYFLRRFSNRMLEEAFQFAAERKDVAALDFISTRCVKPSHREIAARVQQMRDALGAR